MNWPSIVTGYQQYLIFANGLLLLLALGLWSWTVAQRRSWKRALAETESRLLQAEATRVAELEGRIKALTETQQIALEEIRRERRETPRPYPAERVETESSRLDKKHQVVSLAQMGLEARDISRKLRLPLGETELLLGIWEHYKPSGTHNGRNRLH